MLDILGDKNLPRLRNGARASDRCKSHFQSSVLGTDRSGQVLGRLRNALQAKFSKSMLDSARARIPVLKAILDAIAGDIQGG